MKKGCLCFLVPGKAQLASYGETPRGQLQGEKQGGGSEQRRRLATAGKHYNPGLRSQWKELGCPGPLTEPLRRGTWWTLCSPRAPATTETRDKEGGVEQGRESSAALFLASDLRLMLLIGQIPPGGSLKRSLEDQVHRGQPWSQQKDRDRQILGPHSKPSTLD